jgi:hypothetical protein
MVSLLKAHHIEHEFRPKLNSSLKARCRTPLSDPQAPHVVGGYAQWPGLVGPVSPSRHCIHGCWVSGAIAAVAWDGVVLVRSSSPLSWEGRSCRLGVLVSWLARGVPLPLVLPLRRGFRGVLGCEPPARLSAAWRALVSADIDRPLRVCVVTSIRPGLSLARGCCPAPTDKPSKCLCVCAACLPFQGRR